MNKPAIKRLKELAQTGSDSWKKDFEWEQENRYWIKHSQKIALRILRELRHRNMTQQEFASLMGVSKQQIGKVLKGRENLSLMTITKMAETLQVDILHIIGFDESMEQKRNNCKKFEDIENYMYDPVSGYNDPLESIIVSKQEEEVKMS